MLVALGACCCLLNEKILEDTFVYILVETMIEKQLNIGFVYRIVWW